MVGSGKRLVLCVAVVLLGFVAGVRADDFEPDGSEPAWGEESFLPEGGGSEGLPHVGFELPDQENPTPPSGGGEPGSGEADPDYPPGYPAVGFGPAPAGWTPSPAPDPSYPTGYPAVGFGPAPTGWTPPTPRTDGLPTGGGN